jgi:hypothetical protein
MLILIKFLVLSLSTGFLPSYSPYHQSQSSLLKRMSLTLEDFLRITKENDDAQQRQRILEQQERDHLRDQDQKIRASERAADLAAIEKLVESGVKNEVSRVIQPIQEKNEERLGNIESEMSELKTLLKSVQQYTPSTILNASDSSPLTNPSDVHHVAPPPDITTSSDVQAALAKAKRIISLQPIEKIRDVDRQFRMHEWGNLNHKSH